MSNGTVRPSRAAGSCTLTTATCSKGTFSAGVARAFSAAERILGHRSDALIAVSPSSSSGSAELASHRHCGSLSCCAAGVRSAPFCGDRSCGTSSGRAPRTRPRPNRARRITGGPLNGDQAARSIRRPAAAHIAAADPTRSFLIAGGGELEPRRCELQAHERRPRCRACAFSAGGRDVATVYAASDLVALTSRNEGTPVALIESMAAAVPGVAFAVGGVPDVITTDIDLGVLVPRRRLDAFVERIRRPVARRRPAAPDSANGRGPASCESLSDSIAWSATSTPCTANCCER